MSSQSNPIEIFKQSIEILGKIQPNARFFRVLALIAIIFIIVYELPWMDRLMARVINVPDLRHTVTPRSFDDGTTTLIIEVVNLGYVKAENVFVRFLSRGGEIDSFFVNSDEIYELQQIDIKQGVLSLKLARLAPGARLILEITGHFDSSYNVSITSDQGSSIPGDLPSLPGQVRGYAGTITAVFRRTSELIKQNLGTDNKKLIEVGTSIVGFSDLVSFLESDDFHTIVSAVAIVGLLIGLFFPHLVILIPVIAAAGIALVVNFQISAGFVIALFFGLLLLPACPSVIRGSMDSDTHIRAEALGIVSFVIIIGATAALLWARPISGKWLAIPTALLVLYLLLIISIIVPREKVTPMPQEEHRVIVQAESISPQVYNQLNELTSDIARISERLENVEMQLAQQQGLINQLSQKYAVIVKALRKVIPDQ